MTLETEIGILVREVRAQTALLEKIVRLLEIIQQTNCPTIIAADEVPLEKEEICESQKVIELTQETLPMLLQKLSYNRRKVINLRYGLGNGVCYTLEGTGNIFNTTRERIRQLESLALKKIGRLTNSTKEQVVDAITEYRRNLQSQFSPETILKMSIRDMGYSHRVRKCMAVQGIETVAELIQKTADELMEVPNFGKSSLNEVRERLILYNLKLRNE